VIDVSLARRLVDSQFSQWSDLPITTVELDGWDNRTFRPGDELGRQRQRRREGALLCSCSPG
jgi:hypothetical protein